MPAAKKRDGVLKVVAPLVAIASENGRVSQLFAGDIVPEGTKQESIDHLLSLGYVAQAEAPTLSDEN